MPPLLSGLRLPDVARAHVTQLAADTGETVNLAVLQDGEIVYLLSESGGRMLSARTPVGTRLPGPLHRARQVPARAAARRDRARRRRPRALRAAHARRRDDLGGAARRRSSGSAATGVAQSWEEYEVGLAALAVPVGWLDGPGQRRAQRLAPDVARDARVPRRARRAAARDRRPHRGEPGRAWPLRPSRTWPRSRPRRTRSRPRSPRGSPASRSCAGRGCRPTATRARRTRRSAQAGWIGLHWPERLGGRGLSPLHTVACEERFGYRWLPLSGYLLSVKTIGNALLRFASPALQERLLPEVAAGRLAVLPGLLRARRRLRPRLAAHDRARRRRPLRRLRAQAVDVERRRRRLDLPRRAHGPARAPPRALRARRAARHARASPSRRTRRSAAARSARSCWRTSRSRASSSSATLDGGWAVLMGTLDHERVTSEKVGVVLWLLDRLDELAERPRRAPRLLRLRGEAEAARLHGAARRGAARARAARRPSRARWPSSRSRC